MTQEALRPRQGRIAYHRLQNEKPSTKRIALRSLVEGAGGVGRFDDNRGVGKGRHDAIALREAGTVGRLAFGERRHKQMLLINPLL